MCALPRIRLQVVELRKRQENMPDDFLVVLAGRAAIRLLAATGDELLVSRPDAPCSMQVNPYSLDPPLVCVP